MNGLSFAEPQWIHLLWAVVAFVVLLGWLDRRGADALGKFMTPVLQTRLLSQASRRQRVVRLAFLGLSGVFLTLALMRPQCGIELVATPRSGAEIMICLDVSNSMLAEDVAPNRLGRAKAEIRDLLGYLDGDQVGLIAFAGRATVLSPLTPDFGFLRLALDDAGPRSVARGGTRLEEPITKAIRGFGDTSDVSRSILLITDGEDHDSFPLQAARAAADRGIHLLAIGFGDEAGAEILITDPSTGARSVLRNADGEIVNSRLDGELLREMALITDGAYIPAGTAVLDLESIYQRHIAPLTRGQLDDSTRAISNDVFQWAILLGMFSLLGAVASTARVARGHGTAGAGLLLTVVLAGVVTSEPLSAAEEGQAPPGSELQIPGDAREAYNAGVEHLERGEITEALALLEAARDRASTDGEVRFRASYNLGSAEVKSADAQLEAHPDEALASLHRAIGWFQEAVNLRPNQEDARYNLETVMRRALQLADFLGKQNEADLRQSLDELIANQRAFLSELRSLVKAEEEVDRSKRNHFRQLAARELAVLTLADQLNNRTVAELEALEHNDDEEINPQDRIRAAQLGGVLRHLHQTRERIAQARNRLRRLQGARAYRRAANALEAAKYARDQLLDPVARLDALIADAGTVARLTALKVATDQGVEASAEQPAWLTPEHLKETQESIAARTRELHTGLKAGLADDEAQPATSAVAEEPGANVEKTKLLQQLRDATPLIGQADEAFARALADLALERHYQALIAQTEAITALTAAREQLLDLRGLLELIFALEKQIDNLLVASTTTTNETESSSSVVESLHGRNVQRMIRLGEVISDAMAAALVAESAETEDAAGQSSAGERQRYEAAYDLWGAAIDEMHEVEALLAAETEESVKLGQTRESVAKAVVRLDELRQLFFSVIEHLQALAERQLAVNDETETIAALANDNNTVSTSAKVGPLTPRQDALAQRASEIAAALREQAAAMAAQNEEATADQSSVAARFPEAAELVTSAGENMREALSGLESDPPVLGKARQEQDVALAELLEAIALFADPDQAGSGKQEQSTDDGEQQAQDEQPAPQPDASGSDLAQLLQGVRDREAERRQEHAQDRQQGYEAVEKDW